MINRGLNISSIRSDSLEQTMVEHITAQKILQTPLSYLELGCGEGAFFQKIFSNIQNALLIDFCNPSQNIQSILKSNTSIKFEQKDFKNLASNSLNFHPNLFVAQRSLHYVPFETAKKILAIVLEQLQKNSFGIITLSSLHSEHSEDYADAHKPIEKRFCKLSIPNQTKHQIKEPVCLYHISDIHRLLDHPKIKNVQIGISDFGNIKISFVTY